MAKKPSQKRRGPGAGEIIFFAIPRAIGGIISAVVVGVLRLLFGKKHVATGLQPEVPDEERVSTGNEGVFRGVVISTGIFIALSLLLIVMGNFPKPPTAEGAAGMAFAEWQELKAEEEAYLESYGWIDEDAGIVHLSVKDVIRTFGKEDLLPSRYNAPASSSEETAEE
jgi:hypothetical protein